MSKLNARKRIMFSRPILFWRIGCPLFFLFLILVSGWNYVQRNNAHFIINIKNHTIAEQQSLIDEITVNLQNYQDKLVTGRAKITAQAEQLYTLKLSNSDQLMQLKRKEKDISTLKSSFRSELNKQLAAERKMLQGKQAELDLIHGESQLKLANLQRQTDLVESKIGDIASWEKKKAEFDTQYTYAAKEAINEQKIDELMSQFNRLQVDISVINECDTNYLYRYNEAKSILSHISTLIKSNKMKDDYYFYVISNDSFIAEKNRKLCLVN